MSDPNSDGTVPVPPVPPVPPKPPQTPQQAQQAPQQQPQQPQQPQQAPYASAAGYSPPPPAYGPYAGPYAQPKTNSLAIVSLVAALAGLLIIPFIGSVVAVITGHIALGQVSRTGEQGRGLALTGTIVGYVGVAFAVLGIVILLAFIPFMIAGVTTVR